MKILLIAPPWLEIYGNYQEAAKIGCVSPPLGLAYVGAAILNAGHKCQVVDMESEGVSIYELLNIIKIYSPQLVGITSTSPIFSNAKKIGLVIKRHFPEIPLIIGGVHSTILGRELIHGNFMFDIQVTGEGEQTIVEILKAFDDGRDLAGIRGCLYRRNDEIIENPPRPLVENLDDLPKPAHHLLDRNLYKHYLPGRGLITYAGVFTSRGCPFQCVFCSQHTMYGRRVRYHSLSRVIDELRDLVQGLGLNHIIIMDETMTLNKMRMMDLCQAIQDERLRFTWEGWTHASTVDEELLGAMKQAGLIRLSFGIESGDPDILKVIKKNVTLDQIRRAYKIASDVGIETRGSAILGHPFETRISAWRTITFLRSLRDCKQVFLNVACPYPGTELYQYARNGQGGMKLLTEDYSNYKRYGNPIIEVNDLKAKDLKRLQTIGLLYFYLTPGRIWYNLVQRAGIRSGLANALAFIRGAARSLYSKQAKFHEN